MCGFEPQTPSLRAVKLRLPRAFNGSTLFTGVAPETGQRLLQRSRPRRMTPAQRTQFDTDVNPTMTQEHPTTDRILTYVRPADVPRKASSWPSLALRDARKGRARMCQLNSFRGPPADYRSRTGSTSIQEYDLVVGKATSLRRGVLDPLDTPCSKPEVATPSQMGVDRRIDSWSAAERPRRPPMSAKVELNAMTPATGALKERPLRNVRPSDHGHCVSVDLRWQGITFCVVAHTIDAGAPPVEPPPSIDEEVDHDAHPIPSIGSSSALPRMAGSLQ